MAIWVVAVGTIWMVRAARPTPEKITAFVAANPLTEESGPGRMEVIEGVAGKLNRLNFEERRKLQRTGTLREFFESMTDAERGVYLDLTLPEGFKQVMLA
ncbi:MAG: hypothetical protein WA771_09120, partial [Chthoniobacterales bacterium]